jgi:hypothetical protein
MAAISIRGAHCSFDLFTISHCDDDDLSDPRHRVSSIPSPHRNAPRSTSDNVESIMSTPAALRQLLRSQEIGLILDDVPKARVHGPLILAGVKDTDWLQVVQDRRKHPTVVAIVVAIVVAWAWLGGRQAVDW